MKPGLIILMLLALGFCMYGAHKEGRNSMYRDMIQAAGGVPGAKLQVLLPNGDNIYHPAGICRACHTEA